MKPYPMIPIGQVVITHRVSDDLTAGGLQMPDGATLIDFCVGKVIAVGSGYYSVMGSLVPNMVDIGELIIYPKSEVRGITYTIRKHLLERGITEEEIDKTHIVYHDHIVAKLSPLPADPQPFDRPGTIKSILACTQNRWSEDTLNGMIDSDLLSIYRNLMISMAQQ